VLQKLVFSTKPARETGCQQYAYHLYKLTGCMLLA